MNFVNATQSNEERRRKYRAIRDAGFPVVRAQQGRDFTLPSIRRRFGIDLKKLKEEIV